ncbi:MAG: twin-arginine translocation signal domain-containing protein [Kangiellaceae bacterium]|nr:twin-arginine translocation signal domain-containing protein [Kangiellaceae bacterium]
MAESKSLKPKLSRRSLLKASLLGAGVVATGISVWQLALSDDNQLIEQEQFNYQFLSIDDRILLWALIPAYLEAAIDPNEQVIRFTILHNIDSAIGLLPLSTQDELRELLDILTFQLGRAFLARVWSSWTHADLEQLQGFLTRWRESFMTLLRAGYLGLHQLIFGSYYGEINAWQAIGYSGPPQFDLPESFYQQFD